MSRTKLRIHHLLLKGNGQLDNLTLASSNHMDMFYSSADWLVRHQDSSGGWPIVYDFCYNYFKLLFHNLSVIHH